MIVVFSYPDRCTKSGPAVGGGEGRGRERAPGVTNRHERVACMRGRGYVVLAGNDGSSYAFEPPKAPADRQNDQVWEDASADIIVIVTYSQVRKGHTLCRTRDPPWRLTSHLETIPGSPSLITEWPLVRHTLSRSGRPWTCPPASSWMHIY